MFLELPHQVTRERVPPIGTIEREDRDRPFVDASHKQFTHRRVSSGSPEPDVSGTGSLSSRIAVPSALPWVSIRSERLAPPPRAFSITKLNARRFGNSYRRTCPTFSGLR